MENKTNNYLWAQFGASIDMLENAINMCPEKIWNLKNDFSDFWYLVYHTLFWLDFYLTEVPENSLHQIISAPRNWIPKESYRTKYLIKKSLLIIFIIVEISAKKQLTILTIQMQTGITSTDQ